MEDCWLETIDWIWILVAKSDMIYWMTVTDWNPNGYDLEFCHENQSDVYAPNYDHVPLKNHSFDLTNDYQLSHEGEH